MELFRWPGRRGVFSDLERMQQEMERVFSAVRPWTGIRPSTHANVYPALNIYDDGESFFVRAELPGVRAKDIDITMTADTLTIQGRRETPVVPKNACYHRREREMGQFRRAFTLPEQVNSDKVMATCKNGILEVYVPRSDKAKRRSIDVKSSS